MDPVFFTTKRDLIAWIEEHLGSEGSLELAEQVCDRLNSRGVIEYDEPFGFHLTQEVDLCEIAAAVEA